MLITLRKPDFGWRFLLVFSVALLILGSCNDEEPCIISTQARVNIGFYHLVDGVEEDTALLALSVKGIIVNDSILYDSVTNLSNLTLPLSQLEDQSSFNFTFTLPRIVQYLTSVPVIDSIWTNHVEYNVTVQDTAWLDLIIKAERIEYYTLTEVLKIYYDHELTLISEACGFTHYFTIDRVISSRNIMDSIIVTDPEITTSDEENIKIYF